MKRATLKACLKKANELCFLIETLERTNDKFFKEQSQIPMDKKAYEYFQEVSIGYTRESAQLKRTSLDLTHLLADLRLNR